MCILASHQLSAYTSQWEHHVNGGQWEYLENGGQVMA